MTCTRLPRKTGGRVAFSRLTHWATDWTGIEGDRRPAECDGVRACARHARQSDRPTEDARLRFIYAQGSRPVCAVCGEEGSFALALGDPGRLVISHTVPVALYGNSSAINLHASHGEGCNADAGDRDLRGIVAPVLSPWPSLASALAWARTPHRRWLGESPSIEAQRLARRARGIAW